MEECEFLVIGAGPAGLAFASQLGPRAVVLEAGDRPGGLCRSIEFDGGVFDIGGHSFHTPYPEIAGFVHSLMNGAMVSQPRDAQVWHAGERISYPFQHHFEQLGNAAVVADCRGHAADPVAVAQSANFEEWIECRFGAGIARHFMLPYNRKLWGRDLKTMGCGWVSERVATDREEQDGAARRQPLLKDSTVSYPASGGFGEIFAALAARCHRIELGEKAVAVDALRKTVATASGRTWKWKRLVNTAPLTVFLKMLDGCDAGILRMAEALEAVSLKVLLLLVKSDGRKVPQRIYAAGNEVLAHKIAFNNTSSPVPMAGGRHAIMCEVSYSPYKPAPAGDVPIATTLGWLRNNGFVSADAGLVGAQIVDVEYGYPVPTPGLEDRVAAIKAALGEIGIDTIGQFGAWQYANSDECIRQGLALAQSAEADKG
jgi:protoporphyrinogen oxidase